MTICFWPTIQSITAAPSTSPDTPIARDSQWTIVSADVYNPSLHHASLTTSSFDIGDVVEVHCAAANGVVGVRTSCGVDIGTTPCFCRKIATDRWSAVQ